MAARAIPFVATPQNISITATDANPEGCILTTIQTSVTFTNNSGYPIDITFNPTGIFNNVTNLPPTAGSNVNTQPAPANFSVNYNVTVHIPGGTVTNGPYAIQAGTGSMVVMVSGSGNSITCVPDPVAIPVGGNLKMSPAVNSNQYAVAWTDGDPFTIPITTVDNVSHTENPQDGPGQYRFTVTKTSPRETGPGGGKVIVVNT
jgi:hypothetical protein